MIAIMSWSLQEFGEDAALRYGALMTQALSDIAIDPARPGVLQRSDLAEGVLAYHLSLSRERASSGLGIVRNPRHFVIYRRPDQSSMTIDVLRGLHDTREPARHLPEAYRRGD